MNPDIFKDYSEKLVSLPDQVKNDIIELIFSYRSGVLSVSAVFNTIDSLKTLLPFPIPLEISSATAVNYALDLESVSTDIVRVYYRPIRNPNVEVIGYYLSSTGDITQKKIYNIFSRNSLSIDRYDSSNNLISSGEKEGRCEEIDWGGPKEIVNIARDHDLLTLFIKKQDKDQSYIVIRDKNV